MFGLVDLLFFDRPSEIIFTVLFTNLINVSSIIGLIFSELNSMYILYIFLGISSYYNNNKRRKCNFLTISGFLRRHRSVARQRASKVLK